MSVRLEDTTAAQVGMAISAERFRQGSSAVGRVLTLVIIADEATQSDAVRAAAEAAREHPCRILTAIPRPGRGPARLDAEITVGGADGLGELAVLRLRGQLCHHVAPVVLPLLVPDAPVVVWWPGAAPENPSLDPVGMLAQRRITDSAEAARPLKFLDVRRLGYRAGDTDLAWTRITPWRALIASTLDQPYEPITGAAVHAQRNNPSAVLLAAWLQRGLGVPVETHTSRGPGITGVTITTRRGDIAINRTDGRVARMTRPGYPEREAALQRRSIEGLIAEELRRLDPDEVYGETLAALPSLAVFASHVADDRRASATEPARTPAKAVKTAAKAVEPATKAVKPATKTRPATRAAKPAPTRTATATSGVATTAPAEPAAAATPTPGPAPAARKPAARRRGAAGR